ncbi:MAG TPA: GAF domain-containing protein [Bryobacteraceae bacterium]|nr:GAF domain-containing protein [Bryobacteraceae bacterium]
MATGIQHAGVIALLLSAVAAAQTPMALGEASRRKFPALTPLHTGEVVTLEGIVASWPIPVLDYSHLVLQDETGHGFTIEAPHELLKPLTPGGHVRTTGIIANRAGLPVLHPRTVTKLGEVERPAPARLRVQDLNNPGFLGRYVITEGYVLSSGQNAAGDVMLIGDRLSTLAVFLPKQASEGGSGGLRRYRPGDKVRVTGISSQYCPVEPFDRGYQVVIGNPKEVSGIARGWFIATETLLYLLIGVVFALGTWWLRERVLAGQRRVIRSVMNLSEEILTAPAAVDIARKLDATLPSLLGTEKISLFLYKAGTRSLERVPTESGRERTGVSIDAPMGTFMAAAALCFRNRALLELPNVRKSPIIDRDLEDDLPKAAVFVPLIAQTDPLGVLALCYKQTIKRMSDDQRTVMQHLGNQIAASLRLEEQQWMREQLLRSEKMAAAGQLISAVADELREPLLTIARLAQHAAKDGLDKAPALEEISSASQRGVEVVDHLVGLARMERSEPKPLDLFSLVSSIVELRQEECALKGVQLESSLPLVSLQVLGDRGQLEQVFLGLLLHAERSAATSATKNISVTGRLVGKRIQIGINYPGEGMTGGVSEESVNDDDSEIRLWQALVQAHNGDLKVIHIGAMVKAEVMVPVHDPGMKFEEEAPPARKAQRVLSVLLVEPDVQVQRRLLAYLSARGHRVIPSDAYEAAADLVQRFSFDVVFCGERLSGSNWVDFYQRIRRRVSSFVLLTDAEVGDEAPAFRTGEIFHLLKPVREQDLDRLLRTLESRESPVLDGTRKAG